MVTWKSRNWKYLSNRAAKQRDQANANLNQYN